MKSKPANTVQRKLMSDIAEWANDGGLELLYDCDLSKGFELHHVKGRSFKHNKIAIGHEFVYPVPYQYHAISEKNDLNVSYFKHNFTDKFGMESFIYLNMINDMKEKGYTIPSDKIISSIMDTGA